MVKEHFFFLFWRWIPAAVLLTLCEWLMFLNNAGINVICWSVFLLEVTATEWQRARFGFAHTCPWVFSAWCWWTSTLRVKGLSYKSGTIALEVKTCTMPQTWGGGQEHGEVKGAKQKLSGVCMSGCISSWNDISKWPLLGDSRFDKTCMQPSRIWQVNSVICSCP